MTRREFAFRSASAGIAVSSRSHADPVMHDAIRLDGSRVRASEIDERITRLMREAKIPGLCVAILNQGKRVYLRAFGLRNVEEAKPLTEDTIMYGASFTKAVFAYTVMQLVDEKILDLDRPVYEYLPKPVTSYEKWADLAADQRYKKLTVRILLSHTTGFPNFRWLNENKKLDFKWDPGTKYGYSGEGINLCGFVVEQVTGNSLTDLIKARVFDRLGMKRTSMIWQPEFDSNFAIGYDEQQKPLGHRRRDTPGAAGSLETTIADYASFIEAVFARRGLSKKSWDAMLSPQIRIHSKQQFPTISSETTTENDGIQLSYGLGWGVFQSPYGKAYFKEGHDDGWENHSVCFDHNQTGLILMSNSSNADGTYKELLEFLIGDKFTPWKWESYIPFKPGRAA